MISLHYDLVIRTKKSLNVTFGKRALAKRFVHKIVELMKISKIPNVTLVKKPLVRISILKHISIHAKIKAFKCESCDKYGQKRRFEKTC